MSGTPYPRGIIPLDGSSKAFHRLHPYQQRRLALQAKHCGTKEAIIDDLGHAHYTTPEGFHVTVRRPAGRLFASAYWGICAGGWIDIVTKVHPSMIGFSALVAAQILLHHVWPRQFPRRKKAISDQVIQRVL